jgi:hypothetical protein
MTPRSHTELTCDQLSSEYEAPSYSGFRGSSSRTQFFDMAESILRFRWHILGSAPSGAERGAQRWRAVGESRMMSCTRARYLRVSSCIFVSIRKQLRAGHDHYRA